MVITEYEEDRLLVCEHENHSFELTRDIDGGFGNWYMRVTDETGAVCCDGWIDDSQSIGPCNAMNLACDGAELKRPTHWPVHPAKLAS